MKIQLEIDESAVILQILKKERQVFTRSIGGMVPIYSYDKDEEKKMIKKMLKSFDLLIDYYGGNID
jgi:hypothetical protein